ncbi:MAG: hypothetical protein IPP34_09430 [Bacteroidetes bacterium]|nr:hypothetical protein [Bacteroidota bacterium]
MNFRSDTNLTINDLNLSYLPALTKQQTYRLATIYPYTSITSNGLALRAVVYYHLNKAHLGGKYGTYIPLNYSRANSLDTTSLNNEPGCKANFLFR